MQNNPERITQKLFGVFLGIGVLFLLLALVFFFILQDILFEATILFCLIFAFVGLIFFLIGGIALLALASARRRRQNLWTTGRRIDATVIAVEINHKIQYGYQNPWRIVCREDGGTGRLFRSPNLWQDPGAYIRPGDTISVYLDAEDSRKYAVDTRFLTNMSTASLGPEIR